MSVLERLPAGQAFTEATERLQELGGVASEQNGITSVTVPAGAILDALSAAKRAGMVMLTDIFGIDYLTYPSHRGKRFAVVYNLHDLTGAERLFIRVELDDGEELPTATGIWRGADFLERETYDMFGVVFKDHPNLRKLLTPEDLDGHPHRKDFPLGETPTLFNDGRFLDPPAFRAGLMGKDPGLTGWRGGARHGVTSTHGSLPADDPGAGGDGQ